MESKIEILIKLVTINPLLVIKTGSIETIQFEFEIKLVTSCVLVFTKIWRNLS